MQVSYPSDDQVKVFSSACNQNNRRHPWIVPLYKTHVDLQDLIRVQDKVLFCWSRMQELSGKSSLEESVIGEVCRQYTEVIAAKRLNLLSENRGKEKIEIFHLASYQPNCVSDDFNDPIYEERPEIEIPPIPEGCEQFGKALLNPESTVDELEKEGSLIVIESLKIKSRARCENRMFTKDEEVYLVKLNNFYREHLNVTLQKYCQKLESWEVVDPFKKNASDTIKRLLGVLSRITSKGPKLLAREKDLQELQERFLYAKYETLRHGLFVNSGEKVVSSWTEFVELQKELSESQNMDSLKESMSLLEVSLLDHLSFLRNSLEERYQELSLFLMNRPLVSYKRKFLCQKKTEEAILDFHKSWFSEESYKKLERAQGSHQKIQSILLEVFDEKISQAILECIEIVEKIRETYPVIWEKEGWEKLQGKFGCLLEFKKHSAGSEEEVSAFLKDLRAEKPCNRALQQCDHHFRIEQAVNFEIANQRNE